MCRHSVQTSAVIEKDSKEPISPSVAAGSQNISNTSASAALERLDNLMKGNGSTPKKDEELSLKEASEQAQARIKGLDNNTSPQTNTQVSSRDVNSLNTYKNMSKLDKSVLSKDIKQCNILKAQQMETNIADQKRECLFKSEKIVFKKTYSFYSKTFKGRLILI